MNNLPNMKKPCKECPFRKNSLKGWLGRERMKEILNQDSFTCHKTDRKYQCAGHMLIKKEENSFYKLAKSLGIPLNLSGEELIFQSKEDCEKHHE